MRCAMIIDCAYKVSDHTPSVTRVIRNAERHILSKLLESRAGDYITDLRLWGIFARFL